ncbi:MAG: metallophosphoesterase family protein [Planctomycetes bacterium]|nr:metallophosphoesterase family protein [Planctomycetota bacterium]
MIAIISDIHSNIEALKAVATDIKAKNITRVVVLGDVVGYGPNPAECLKLIRQLKPEVILMGNHEHALIHGSPHNMHPRARTTIDWTRSILSQEDLDYIRGWPTEFNIDGTVAFHASPCNHVMEYIFPHDIKRPAIMRERFDKIPDRHCVVGHVHIPGVFTENMEFIRPADLMSNLYLFGDEKAIINVGSVGQPRDHDNRSCYVTFDGDAVIFRRVAYNYRKTQKKILAIKGFDPFLAQRLEIGR